MNGVEQRGAKAVFICCGFSCCHFLIAALVSSGSPVNVHCNGMFFPVAELGTTIGRVFALFLEPRGLPGRLLLCVDLVSGVCVTFLFFFVLVLVFLFLFTFLTFFGFLFLFFVLFSLSDSSSSSSSSSSSEEEEEELEEPEERYVGNPNCCAPDVDGCVFGLYCNDCG